MRCNWSSTANTLLRSFIQPTSPVLHRLWYPRATLIGQQVTLLSPKSFHVSAPKRSPPLAATQPPTIRTPEVHFPEAELVVTGSSTSSPMQLTDAQLSRAACQAVRLTCHTNEFRNAFYIVNSLRYALVREKDKNVEKLYGLRKLVQEFDAIDFGRPVSPRLACHALLHGLIRHGMSIKATKLAELMMKDGIRLRSATLEATVRCLLPDAPATHGAGSALSRILNRGTHERPEILTLLPSMVEDQCIRFAIRLVFRARQYQQRRTKKIFQFLINACLLQGEIIVGSLLFVLVVKDWELRKSLAAQLAEATRSQDEATANDANLNARYNHLRSESIFPPKALMYSLLSSIDAVISRDRVDEASQLSFRASLQALANLAVLLDRRQIPFPEISPLIHTLYGCPRVDYEVWIDHGGGPVLVNAYSYFHQVLKRLINSLPTKRPPRLFTPAQIPSALRPPGTNQDRYLLPPLDRASYNTLLNYALRHRLSPALGNKILNHMTKERYRPVDPDIITYNILIRSGTLMGKHRITEQALEALRRRQENENSGITISTHDTDTFKDRASLFDSPSRTRLSKALYRVKIEDLDLTIHHPPDRHSRLPARPIIADSYTLSSYVIHLTSTGQPHVVADLLFHIFPELATIDHLSEGTMASVERNNLHADSRLACLKRAVAYGPNFFTSVLNALSKAGKTGLTERVWVLAKQAERASWIEDFSPNTQPWCLPVHAYTTMIQCYGAEARKVPFPRQADRHILEPGDLTEWVPRSKRYVVGWAGFIVARSKILKQNHSRATTGRRMAILLLRSMRSGAHAVYEALMEIQKLKKFRLQNMNIPQPDARFFNAVLDLFARQPNVQPRSPRVGPAHCRRHLRLVNAWYARLGKLPDHWDPLLQEVAEQMLEAGYPVPPGLRHIFVGRWTPGTIHRDNPPILDRRPYAFPRAPTTFRPHNIPTHKKRGLPVGTRRRYARISSHY